MEITSTTLLSLLLPSQLDWLLIATIVTSVVTLALVKKWLLGGESKGRRLPPGPWGLPLLGSILSLTRLPHRGLWRLSQKYGDIMMLRLGTYPFVVVSSARGAREFLVHHDREFSDRPYLEVNKRVLWNRSLAFIDAGERWREGRRVCATQLFAPKRLLSLEGVRVTAVSDTLQRIRQSCADNGGQTTKIITCKSKTVDSSIWFTLNHGQTKNRTDAASRIPGYDLGFTNGSQLLFNGNVPR